jgi:LuxR family transcriptional regulator, maltose regulon positive regulatory protein
MIPILTTKLYIPPSRPKMVLRPRLIERLNEDLCQNQGFGRKLTLISAPAGFGKTTLVREWVAGWQGDEPEIGIAWLSLDEGDNDTTRFLIYLVAALQTVLPNVGVGILDMLQSPHPPPPKLILTDLLNEITATPANFILVLDDYHVIDSKVGAASRSIDEALAFLLEHMPHQMHLVISSREDPNLPLARLRSHGLLVELRVSDLRFNSSEAAEFIHKVMGLDISVADAAALETRTEGWVAGLQLAALAVRDHPDVSSFIQSFTGSHHFVLDYLMEEVLNQQPESIQTFLLNTSILERMCGPLCDAVLGDLPAVGPEADGQATEGQKILEYLEHGNLFIVPLDNERHWYRYHHLFADLLRQRLGQSQTPEEVARYHLYASEWYEKTGDMAESFHHLIAAREFSRAAAVAEKSWQGMNESFQSAAWLGWVKQLPEELICSLPVLCTQIAWSFMNAGEVDASESRLRDAEQCLESPLDEMTNVDVSQLQTLPARIAFARAYNAQTQRDYPATVKYAELVYKLTPEKNHYLRAQTTAVLGATYWASGDLEAACRSMSDWIDRSRKVGNLFFAIASASAKADILTAQGKLREALDTYQQSLQLASMNEQELQRITAKHYLGLALLYHEMGDETAAAEHFEKSLVQGEQSVSADWPYRRSLAQARFKESEREWDAALDLLDEAQCFFFKSLIPDTRPIDVLKARIDLKRGRLDKVREWARVHNLSADDDLHYLNEFEHITLARLLLVEYQNNRIDSVLLDAKRLLARLLEAAEDGKRMGSVLEILVVQALVDQAQSSQTGAFVSLERALALAQPEGYLRIFINEGTPMRSLLIEYRRSFENQLGSSKHELTSYVDKLLSAFPLSSEMQKAIQNKSEDRTANDSLEDPLSQREIEVLRLIAQGLSNREISERLFLALNTVKGYNQKIFNKLHVQSRTEAIVRVRELDLL